jgi:hypothetical protein
VEGAIQVRGTVDQHESGHAAILACRRAPSVARRAMLRFPTEARR